MGKKVKNFKSAVKHSQVRAVFCRSFIVISKNSLNLFLAKNSFPHKKAKRENATASSRSSCPLPTQLPTTISSS